MREKRVSGSGVSGGDGGKASPFRHLYVGFGFLFFALGAVGAAVPVLPTTPFLLLAAYCFARGSRRFNAWFVSTGLYQRHLAGFIRERSMTRRTKVVILAWATAMLALAFFAMDNPYGRACVAAVLAVKYWYFLCRIKTAPPAGAGERVASEEPGNSAVPSERGRA